MRETSESDSPAYDVRPDTITAALWIGWSYQALVLAVQFFYALPKQKAYIDDFTQGKSPYQQMTQADINMVLNPNAALFGTASSYVLWFALSAWLLYKIGRGRAWARIVLACFFGFRVLIGAAIYPNAFTVFDIVAQVTVIVLLFLPASRAWFSRTRGQAVPLYR